MIETGKIVKIERQNHHKDRHVRCCFIRHCYDSISKERILLPV
jgi:hypothetical protein